MFEQVLKSCKGTNAEFLMFKEKLGICLYEENYYEEEIIKIQDEEPIEEINKVSNKKLTKESTKELIKKLDEYSDEESDEMFKESNEESDNKSTKNLSKELIKKSDKNPNKKSVNKSNNKSIERFDEILEKREEESIEGLRKEFSLNNKSTTNWYDRSKFNKMLTTIDNNNFNYKNKIGKFKFNDINNLINNIKNDTISEADTKKKINKLNEIKNVETKGKRLIDSQKSLLSLFDNLV